MRMRALLAGLCLAASAAQAEPPLTAEAFDALTLGRTMTWAEFGQVYGVEQYLPDRRVRWTMLGDICTSGRWYPLGSEICFQYDHKPAPVCWTMTIGEDGLLARHASRAPDDEAVRIKNATEPMACFGPEVGV